MKRLIALLLLILSLQANEYNDDDLDGVPNYLDRCPNTPFSDIVDEYGCSIERLIRPKRFEYFFEYLYAKESDRGDFKENDYLGSFTFYRGNFDLSLTSFYFTNRFRSGFADLNIKAQYRYTPVPMWDIYLGVGVDLPIYNIHGNRVDYNLYLSNEYYFLGYKLFGGLYFTRTTDRLRGERLHNSYGGYGGIEIYKQRYSFDIVYLYNKSKFHTISNMLYFKLERTFAHNYFLFGTYTLGLNRAAIDSIVSIGFGRRF